jgi:hypothetical protein
VYDFRSVSGGEIEGEKLEVICVNENQLIFHFSNKLSIEILGKYKYSLGNIGKVLIVPDICSELFQLIGACVASNRVSLSSMVLQFENDATLKIYNDPHYEVAHIHLKNRVIII